MKFVNQTKTSEFFLARWCFVAFQTSPCFVVFEQQERMVCSQVGQRDKARLRFLKFWFFNYSARKCCHFLVVVLFFILVYFNRLPGHFTQDLAILFAWLHAYDWLDLIARLVQSSLTQFFQASLLDLIQIAVKFRNALSFPEFFCLLLLLFEFHYLVKNTF